jgi:hypothetical protein
VGGAGYWSGRAVAHGRKHKHYNVTRHKYDSRANSGEQCCDQAVQETATTPRKPVNEFTCCGEWYVHYSAGERCCNGTTTETRLRQVENGTNATGATQYFDEPYQHVIGFLTSGVYWSLDPYRQVIGHKGAGMIYGEWSAATANGAVPRESGKLPLVCCAGEYSLVGDRCCGRKNYTLSSYSDLCQDKATNTWPTHTRCTGSSFTATEADVCCYHAPYTDTRPLVGFVDNKEYFHFPSTGVRSYGATGDALEGTMATHSERGFALWNEEHWDGDLISL